MPKRSATVPKMYHAYRHRLAMQIGKRVRERRRALMLTQDGLRHRLQLESVFVTRSQHSRIELGERLPLASEVIAYSRVLGVQIAWLLTGKGEST